MSKQAVAASFSLRECGWTNVASRARKLKLAAAIWMTASAAALGWAQTNSGIFPIDLPTALKLAGAQNLDVQLARERVTEAKAQHEQARMQFFPWIAPSVGYKRHDGNIQDVAGNIFNASKQSVNVGGSLNAQLDLGDAIYKSLVARQLARAAEEAAEARRQESVFGAAAGYFELARAKSAVGVAKESVRLADEYARQLNQAIEAGMAFKGDAFRAQVQVEKNHITLRQAEEQQRLASARLAQTLHLQPATELAPEEAELAPLTLMETNAALDTLMGRAMASRPELRQFDAQALAAKRASDGAQYGPLIPTIGAQAYLGGLGGGRNGSLSHFDDTQDYLLGLSWRIGPGGLFDRSRIRAADARMRAGELELAKVRDEVGRQVVEAHTRVYSLSDQLAMSKRALTSAEQLFKLTRERKQFGVGVVLEDLLAEQELTRARLDYLNVVAEFDKAQFALQRAVGGTDGAVK